MRKRFAFWLNDKRDDDIELNNLIEDLKRDRLFSRAIREGLRMWVESQSEPSVSTVGKSDGGAGQLDEIKAMLELIVTQQKNGSGYVMQSVMPPPTTGKQLGGFKTLAPPADDDDDLPTIVISKSMNESSALNFVTALKSMQF